jgi:hypothetical protein
MESKNQIQYEHDHSKLMTEWRNKYSDKIFIEDGIIDFPTWEKQENKILILLKEAYQIDGKSEFKLTKNLFDNGRYHNIWHTVARMIKAVELTKAHYLPCLEEVENYDNDILRKIAVINIKKADGRNGSEYEELMAVAENDKDLLKSQIEIINPTIIICGGTKHFLDDNFWNDLEFEKIPQTDDLVHKSPNKTLFAVWHPSYQVPSLMKHYLFAGIYQKYLQQTNSKP